MSWCKRIDPSPPNWENGAKMIKSTTFGQSWASLWPKVGIKQGRGSPQAKFRIFEAQIWWKPSLPPSGYKYKTTIQFLAWLVGAQAEVQVLVLNFMSQSWFELSSSHIFSLFTHTYTHKLPDFSIQWKKDNCRRPSSREAIFLPDCCQGSGYPSQASGRRSSSSSYLIPKINKVILLHSCRHCSLPTPMLGVWSSLSGPTPIPRFLYIKLGEGSPDLMSGRFWLFGCINISRRLG